MKSKHPLLKLLIFLAFGYIIGFVTELNVYFVISISIVSLLIYFVKQISLNIRYFFITTSIGLLLFSSVNRYSLNELDNKITNSFEGVYSGKVLEILTSKENIKRFVAEGVLQSGVFSKQYKCNVIFTLFDKNNKLDLYPGDKFLTKSTFISGQPKILDEDFNEKSYLISKKSLFFGTTNTKSFALQTNEFTLSYYFYKLRKSIVSDIRTSIPDEKIAGILIALTTGDKSIIDKDLQYEFSATGTAHILAISGLHVGIFSLFIYVLTGGIRSQKLKLLIFLIVLWSFIFFVGCPPSAVRAASMASVFLYFIYYGKSPNLLNILLLTIIVFILINPTILYSISFQLSIFAISGIFILYKPIYNRIINLIRYRNKLTVFFSSSIAISFAATIPTSFLTAYYFNTFSIIYPIANLIILPLMSLAAFESILFAIFSSIGLPFSILFIKTAYFLTDISIQINKLFAKIGEFNFNLNSTELLFLSLISSSMLIYMFVSKTNRTFLFRTSVSVMISFLIITSYKIDSNKLTILTREQYGGFILDTDSSKYILLADRKKYDYLKLDYGLIKHISKTNKQVYIYKTGNVSINIVDQVKMKNNVKHNFISIRSIDSLSKLIKKPLFYRNTKINA